MAPKPGRISPGERARGRLHLDRERAAAQGEHAPRLQVEPAALEQAALGPRIIGVPAG
jgi:hypothetical protein